MTRLDAEMSTAFPAAAPVAAGTGIHVTAATVARTRRRVDGELKGAISHLKLLVRTVDVAAPGFGVIGDLIVGSAYEAIQDHAHRLLGDAEEAVDGWTAALGVAQRNWQAAEAHSIIREQS